MYPRRTLGVIGGMGPQATQCFYQDIIDNTVADKDQDHIDMVIINHASMPDRTSAILIGNTAPVYSRLKNDAEKLIKFGVDYIAMPCNTSHYFIDRLKSETGASFIDMIEETAILIRKRNISRVGLMATNGTVMSRIYEIKMKEHGIDIILPSEEKQSYVMQIIYDQIKAGIAPDKRMFEEVSRELEDRGAEAVILGCTELSYYNKLHNLSEYYFDAQEILVRKCIELCGGRQERV